MRAVLLRIWRCNMIPWDDEDGDEDEDERRLAITIRTTTARPGKFCYVDEDGEGHCTTCYCPGRATDCQGRRLRASSTRARCALSSRWEQKSTR